jgi:single-stranded DNA-binding protein
LKFVGNSLVKAANYIGKGAPVSVTGTLTFEHWTDDNSELQSRAVVAVSEVQLPAKTTAV